VVGTSKKLVPEIAIDISSALVIGVHQLWRRRIEIKSWHRCLRGQPDTKLGQSPMYIVMSHVKFRTYIWNDVTRVLCMCRHRQTRLDPPSFSGNARAMPVERPLAGDSISCDAGDMFSTQLEDDEVIYLVAAVRSYAVYLNSRVSPPHDSNIDINKKNQHDIMYALVFPTYLAVSYQFHYMNANYFAMVV